jgi:hypothetical protein
VFRASTQLALAESRGLACNKTAAKVAACSHANESAAKLRGQQGAHRNGNLAARGPLIAAASRQRLGQTRAAARDNLR